MSKYLKYLEQTRQLFKSDAVIVIPIYSNADGALMPVMYDSLEAEEVDEIIIKAAKAAQRNIQKRNNPDAQPLPILTPRFTSQEPPTA